MELKVWQLMRNMQKHWKRKPEINNFIYEALAATLDDS